MENPIRGAIFSKYSSISAFAKAAGWSRNKASRIVNLVTKPSVSDMEKIAEVLDIVDSDRFMSIFFPGMTTK